MTLRPGERIGSYEVVSAIGAGGMGEVFRARDAKLDRDVAIKVLPAELAQDRERLARFEVAFVDETVLQVHVRSLSGTGSIQVSDEGGGYAVWGPREGQLFYGFGGPVEADLAFSPLLAVRRRQRVETWSPGERLVDISADGKTFLINQPTTEGPQALVALNWGASVTRRSSRPEN